MTRPRKTTNQLLTKLPSSLQFLQQSLFLTNYRYIFLFLFLCAYVCFYNKIHLSGTSKQINVTPGLNIYTSLGRCTTVFRAYFPLGLGMKLRFSNTSLVFTAMFCRIIIRAARIKRLFGTDTSLYHFLDDMYLIASNIIPVTLSALAERVNGDTFTLRPPVGFKGLLLE
jgi:hypothetical protein